jgi:hypothetical protein
MLQDSKSWDMDRDPDELLQHVRGQLAGVKLPQPPAAAVADVAELTSTLWADAADATTMLWKSAAIRAGS